MVLEVMGRDAGHIALHAGIAGGADVILLPEISYSIGKIAQKIEAIRARGRNSALVVVSEAVKTVDGKTLRVRHRGGTAKLGGIGHYLGDLIAEETGADTRVTVLGHVQRGCPPSAQDRLIASAFGVHAVELIAEGKFDRMVAWQNRRVVDVPLADAIARYQAVDVHSGLVKTARALGICLGD
jgi:6-phosphofructokinase 1